MLRQTSSTLAFDTLGRGLFEITSDISEWVAETDLSDGLLTLFLRHTSASLLIQENAEVLNGACLLASCHAWFVSGPMTQATLPS